MEKRPLEEKLEANHVRRERERLLSVLPKNVSALIGNATVLESAEELPPIYYATYESGIITTTRGKKDGWNHRNAMSKTDLQSELQKLRFGPDTQGVFFLEAPPYFKLNLTQLQLLIGEILEFCENNKQPDIVFASNASGYVIEFNDRDGYELSWWGL